MSDKPIIFSAPMVRALLDGRKTQTRRVLKLPKGFRVEDMAGDLPHLYGHLPDSSAMRWGDPFADDGGPMPLAFMAPYAIGDRLWVKESWNAFSFSQDGEDAWPTKTIPTAEEMQEIAEAAYRVDVQAVYRESSRAREWFKDQPWRSSIHMPRWASRLTLTVADVRVQRLQDISEADAVAEGALRPWAGSPGTAEDDTRTGLSEFEGLWNSIHGPDAWDENPWVVALTFTVRKGNIDA